MIDWLMTHPDILMFVATIVMLMLGFPVAFTLAGVALAFAFMAGGMGVCRGFYIYAGIILVMFL